MPQGQVGKNREVSFPRVESAARGGGVTAVRTALTWSPEGLGGSRAQGARGGSAAGAGPSAGILRYVWTTLWSCSSQGKEVN